ncbi:MAG: hypothetical protein IPO08_21790 [Xanthomonadales bacterium]|nr:hypothetical protein [Xanthomonadales bacterium]
MKAAQGFQVRPHVSEAQRILAARRLDLEVERVQLRSTFLRRLVCLVLPHSLWRTGLAGRAPTGEAFALVVCRRCGKRFAQPLPHMVRS